MTGPRLKKCTKKPSGHDDYPTWEAFRWAALLLGSGGESGATINFREKAKYHGVVFCRLCFSACRHEGS